VADSDNDGIITDVEAWRYTQPEPEPPAAPKKK
jgi:hypothetical protein